jgi:hypothetical protein
MTDHKSMAFMAGLLTVQCGAVLAIAEWFRRKDEAKPFDPGERPR